MVDITGQYPATTQWVVVGRQSGTIDIHGTPNIQVGAGGASVGVSGVGVDKNRSNNKSFVIELNSRLEANVDRPDTLHWLV